MRKFRGNQLAGFRMQEHSRKIQVIFVSDAYYKPHCLRVLRLGLNEYAFIGSIMI